MHDYYSPEDTDPYEVDTLDGWQALQGQLMEDESWALHMHQAFHGQEY